MRLILLFVPLTFLSAQTHTPTIENESVRVVSVTDAPAKVPGALHEHKQNRVMVYLDSGDIRIQHADGKVENQHWTPGDVAWSPANGMHTSQNVSSRPIRIVEIELKGKGQADTTAPPDRTRSIVDNAQVRVYHAIKGPANRNYVAVNIQTGEVLWDKVPAGTGPFVITEVK